MEQKICFPEGKNNDEGLATKKNFWLSLQQSICHQLSYFMMQTVLLIKQNWGYEEKLGDWGECKMVKNGDNLSNK